MKAVSTFTLRSDLSRYLEEVSKDETSFVVSRFGKPIAVLAPYREEPLDVSSFYGFMGKGEDGDAFLKRVRRSKREKRRIELLRNRS